MVMLDCSLTGGIIYEVNILRVQHSSTKIYLVIHYIYFILQSIINYIHLCAYIILYTSINSNGNTKLPDQENSLQFNLKDFCGADLP